MSGSYCSPSYNNSFTCFSDDQLIKIANTINSRSKGAITIPNTMDHHNRKKLWKSIQYNIKLSRNCNEDYCLLDSIDVTSSIDKTELEQIFRPEKPISWNTNKLQWLSTLDIMRVMNQYEKKYKYFKFFGPTPIDFDTKISKNQCVVNDLCNINLAQLIKQKKYKIGIIFNLDPHYKSGSHWVSLFVDCTTGGIYFFDSFGVKPSIEIQRLMERIKEQGIQLICNGSLDINKIDNTHTIARPFKFINAHTVEVEDPQLYYLNNLLFLGNHTDKLHIDKRSACLIKNKKNNRLYLEAKNLPIGVKDLNLSNLAIMKSFRTFYNDRQFQYKNSECGVYSIYFIESFLDTLVYQLFLLFYLPPFFMA